MIYFFASPPAIILGIFMMRRKSSGYSTGISLLLLLSILCIGLVPVIIIKGYLTNIPGNIQDLENLKV